MTWAVPTAGPFASAESQGKHLRKNAQTFQKSNQSLEEMELEKMNELNLADTLKDVKKWIETCQNKNDFN